MSARKEPLGHHVTASKTDLALACTFWANKNITLPVIDESKMPEAPRRGTAVHAGLERWSKGRDLDLHLLADQYDVDKRVLTNLVDKGIKTLSAWMKDRGLTKCKTFIEKKVAYDPWTDKGRFVDDYTKATDHEIPGTLDWGAQKKDQLFLLDHKTGVTIYDPHENAQLSTLGLGLSRALDVTTDVIVGILKITEDGARVHTGIRTPEKFERHRKRLRRALENALKNTSPIRPGLHCNRCPALDLCPAHAGPIAVANVEDIRGTDHCEFLYERLIAGEELMKRLRSKITGYVQENGEFELKSGEVLVIQKYDRANLSMKSVREAYDVKTAEKMLKRLEKDGAITSSPVEALVRRKSLIGRK